MSNKSVYGQLMELNSEEQPNVPAVEVAKPEPPKPAKQKLASPVNLSQQPKKVGTSSSRDTTTPSSHDTVIPRHHDTMTEAIRAAVRRFGKEAATHRFTQEEKQAIAEVVFTYQRHGIRTSENEITRIGVNYLIEDYHENGENSILDKVLKALNL